MPQTPRSNDRGLDEESCLTPIESADHTRMGISEDERVAGVSRPLHRGPGHRTKASKEHAPRQAREPEKRDHAASALMVIGPATPSANR